MSYHITWRDRANPKKHGTTALGYPDREQAEAKKAKLESRYPEYEYEIEGEV